MCGIVLIMPKRGKLIGREGMTGLPIMVGDHLSPQSTFIQAVGRDSGSTRSYFAKPSTAVRRYHSALLRYVQAFMIQTRTYLKIA